MGLARELAERIVAFKYENLPTAACDGSHIAVLDTLEQLRAMFEQCARPMISAESAQAASQMIAELQSVASNRDLTALLEPVRPVRVPPLAHS